MKKENRGEDFFEEYVPINGIKQYFEYGYAGGADRRPR